jgi:hypothetical protein
VTYGKERDVIETYDVSVEESEDSPSLFKVTV